MQTVDRIIAVLTKVAESPEGLTLSEIARRLDLSIATCHRLLGSLEDGHLIERDPQSKHYHPGIGLIRLATSVSPSLGSEKSIEMTLNALRDRWQECFFLSSLIDGDVVCIKSVEANDPRRISVYVPLGRRLAFHSSASAKVIAAFGPAREISRRLGMERLEAFTQFTITNMARLDRELRTIRQQGWAICDQEQEIGVNALAAPIMDSNGGCSRSIAVVGPRERLVAATDDGLIDDLTASAEYLSMTRVIGEAHEDVS